jgi:3-hydroxyacyl-CoA dehydrogenase
MTQPIRRVGVIGAGVMGGGIAAHLANAGVEALLLDIVPPDLGKHETSRQARNRVAQAGLDRVIASRPALLFHKGFARLIEVGNLEDDFDKLAACDLIVEAIPERLDLKRSLLERLEKTARPDAVVASNTSGIRIASMLEGRGEGFRKRVCVMHFFNPVRYMKLLELVPGPETDPAVLERVRRFGEDKLGKGIVVGKDTPNFVGNRIGTHAMMSAIHLTLAMGLAPEDLDALTGVPMGHPRSASLRTADMVGLDTLAHVAENCHTSLEGDEDREVFKLPDFVRQMVERKLLGDKTKAGFYRKGKDGGIETLDPKTLEYRAKGGDPEIKKAAKALEGEADVRKRVRALVADQGKAGQFAWKALSQSLAYSARRVGEIADDVAAIDEAMRWGYNWELGPFETWDALGFQATTDRMLAEGVALPDSIRKMREKGVESFYRADGAVYDLKKGEYVRGREDPRLVTVVGARKGKAPVFANDGAEAWDAGDGVLAVTFKTKANSIDSDVIAALGASADRAERDFRAIVVANQGEHFCVGANLFALLVAAQNKDWDGIRATVRGYQSATQRLKYAHVPVVIAPYGMTVGGGLELCFAGDAVQAAAETYAGLVEVGVGLVPGGAGHLNMLWRALEGIPEGANVNTYEYVTQVFKNIALAKVATSADEAKALGYFRTKDGVSFDKARLFYEAKARAVGLAESGYRPPAPRAYRLPGESGIATLGMMVDTLVAGGHASEHDALIARKVATVLCGGAGGASREVTEAEILELEAEAFVSLCGEPKTIERVMHMLQTNKPLRN